MLTGPTDFEWVQALVLNSLRATYDRDRALLGDKQHGQPEQALTFRFAHYLAREVDDLAEPLGLSVDCEYRRTGQVIKGFGMTRVGDAQGNKTRGERKRRVPPARVAPDVIIHRRRDNSVDANVLVIECKAGDHHVDRRNWGEVGRRVDPNDDARLRLFTGQIEPKNVEVTRKGEFRARDSEYPRLPGSRWLVGAFPGPYAYGASVLFAPTGVRVAWYFRPDVGPAAVTSEVATLRADNRLDSFRRSE